LESFTTSEKREIYVLEGKVFIWEEIGYREIFMIFFKNDIERK